MGQTISESALFTFVERLPQDAWSGPLSVAPALKLPLRFTDPTQRKQFCETKTVHTKTRA